jgi:molecular chaperone GrpE
MKYIKQQHQSLLAMLPVLDDFDRAMVEILKSETNFFERANSLKEITLISKGLEQVEVKAGDAFDADFAEQ